MINEIDFFIRYEVQYRAIGYHFPRKREFLEKKGNAENFTEIFGKKFLKICGHCTNMNLTCSLLLYTEAYTM